MTGPIEQYDDESPEVLAVDAALSALAARRSTSDDPALLLLGEFAREVDVRAAAVGRGGRTDPVAPVLASSPQGSRRPARTRRPTTLTVLLTAAIAAVVALLVGLLPVNASPSSPLHDLHDLIFQPETPTPEEQVRTDLAAAAQALDGAGDCATAVHTGPLDEARRHLADARRHLSTVDDDAVRASLRSDLSILERRVDDLDECDEPDDGQDGSDDEGQDQGRTDGDSTVAPGSPGADDGDQGGSRQSGE